MPDPEHRRRYSAGPEHRLLRYPTEAVDNLEVASRARDRNKHHLNRIEDRRPCKASNDRPQLSMLKSGGSTICTSPSITPTSTRHQSTAMCRRSPGGV